MYMHNIIMVVCFQGALHDSMNSVDRYYHKITSSTLHAGRGFLAQLREAVRTCIGNHVLTGNSLLFSATLCEINKSCDT